MLSRIFWWIVVILLIAFIFLGAATAGALAGSTASATGFTAGNIIGHIPTFVHSFKEGMHTGGGGQAGMFSGPGTTATAPNHVAPGPVNRPHRHPHQQPNV